MSFKPTGSRSSRDVRMGLAALSVGDLKGAQRAFLSAVRNEPGSAAHRYHLAVVEEALGDTTSAAANLTRALGKAPAMKEAAERLSALLSRGRIDHHSRLHADGLRAALSHHTVHKDVLVAASIYHLADKAPLRDALRRGSVDG